MPVAAGPLAYDNIPPLREGPDAPDRFDDQRVAMARQIWRSQDDVRRPVDRQVEENCRMLAGQHWIVWNRFFQRYEDITEWMSEDEQRWRQRPVLNFLLYWFMLTHSRMTENQPICTFLPSTADAKDALLAEVADTVCKTIWRDANVPEVFDRMFAWMIPGGVAYLGTRVDLTKGELRPWVGQGSLSLLGPDGQPTGITRDVAGVPFDAEGNPLAQLVGDGSEFEVTGQPHMEREGGITVDVYAAPQVRGEWGPAPWHEKSWHATQTFHTPEEVFDRWGVEVEPDTFADQMAAGSELHRLLLGNGWFGSHDQLPGSFLSGGAKQHGLVAINTLWQAPCHFPGMEETDESPGGRLLVTSRTKVLRDGPRPVRYRYTSPIRSFGFVNLPGRPQASSPQEALNPINRSIDRGWAQILEHRNLVANPIGIIDEVSGLGNVEITNKPGQHLVALRRPQVDALTYVVPPSLPADVWRSQAQLEDTFRYLGALHGAEGTPPTADASGELVDQLRRNSDRWLGVTLRRAAEESSRLLEDWLVTIPTIWTEERVIHYAGEDSMAKTVQVYPELFIEGKVHIVPDVESMLPESRAERMARVERMYDKGAFGEPGTPAALRRWLELSRFPNLNRAAQPGGTDRRTAERENGRLMRGEPAQAVAVFPWYDSQTHLAVHEEYMASPEFLELDPAIQDQFVLHRNAHLAHLQTQAQLMAASRPAPVAPGTKAGSDGGSPSDAAEPPAGAQAA